jgi:hypothetical protein
MLLAIAEFATNNSNSTEPIISKNLPNSSIFNNYHLQIQNLKVNLTNTTKSIKEISNQNEFSKTSPYFSIFSALGGAFGGSFLTFIFGKKNEDNKRKYELSKEEDFNKKIIDLIKYELRTYHNLLEEIDKQSNNIEYNNENYKSVKSENRSEILIRLDAIPNQYSAIPVDIKAKLFTSKILTNVEICYNEFFLYISKLRDKIMKYDIQYSEKENQNLKTLISETISALDIKL